MKIPYFLFFLCLIFSCSTEKSNKFLSKEDIIQGYDTVSVFIDSTHIGLPNLNKIILSNIIINDTIPKVYIQFYIKENDNWKLSYSFEDEQWLGDLILPEITDFNNDGYKDLKYLKGRGGRGGNGIYNLFIYDSLGDSLIYVLNSNEFPNLYYNKLTKSINSFILSGGNETVFMKFVSDSLIPFASIFQYGKEITVTEYDNFNNSKTIKIDTSNRFDEFAQFTNFKPLTIEK